MRQQNFIATIGNRITDQSDVGSADYCLMWVRIGLYDAVGARAEKAEAKRDALQAEVARLRFHLNYYAKEHTDPNDGPWGAHSDDFGKTARKALEDKP